MRRKSRKSENNGITSTEDDQTNVKNANGTHNNDDVSDASEPEPKKRKSGKRASASPKKAPKEEKKVQESEKEDDSESEADYEVESIVDQRTVKGVKQYLIKWKGYDSSANTWEAEDSVNCPDLVKKFLESEKKSPKAKKSMKKSVGRPKTKKEEPTQDWDENEEFEVDRIIEVHHKRNGAKEFLVSWKGYPVSQSSWVDEEDMTCKDMIAKFMEKVEKAKTADQKDLRIDRKPTDRFTLNTRDSGRRLSRRNVGKQRVHYHDAE